MTLIDDNYVIQALASNTADHAFDVAILPRTPCRTPHLLNSHSFHPSREGATIDPISISKQISRRTGIRKSFNDLLCGPDRSRMFRDIEMQDTTAIMCQHDKNVQHA